MDSQPSLEDVMKAMEEGMPMLVADDDFIEFVHSSEYEGVKSIEVDVLADIWEEWVKENVE